MLSVSLVWSNVKQFIGVVSVVNRRIFLCYSQCNTSPRLARAPGDMCRISQWISHKFPLLLPPENRFWCRVFNFQKEATVSSRSDIVLSEEWSAVGVVEYTETSLSTSFFIQKLKCEDILNCEAGEY